MFFCNIKFLVSIWGFFFYNYTLLMVHEKLWPLFPCPKFCFEILSCQLKFSKQRSGFTFLRTLAIILVLRKSAKFMTFCYCKRHLHFRFLNFPLNGSNFIMQQNETILTRPNFFPYQTTIIFYDVSLRSHSKRSVLLMFQVHQFLRKNKKFWRKKSVELNVCPIKTISFCIIKNIK